MKLKPMAMAITILLAGCGPIKPDGQDAVVNNIIPIIVPPNATAYFNVSRCGQFPANCEFTIKSTIIGSHVPPIVFRGNDGATFTQDGTQGSYDMTMKIWNPSNGQWMSGWTKNVTQPSPKTWDFTWSVPHHPPPVAEILVSVAP